jgi:hypothetical protein
MIITFDKDEVIQMLEAHLQILWTDWDIDALDLKYDDRLEVKLSKKPISTITIAMPSAPLTSDQLDSL